MIIREITDEEFRKSVEGGDGHTFHCPICDEWYYWDSESELFNPCDHALFFFQRAQGCFDCDINAIYGFKKVDLSKPCEGCWDFNNLGKAKEDILEKAKEVESLMNEKDFPDMLTYFIRYFELMGDLGVDEIIYKYTETPFFHKGWHFYAVGIKK
ncbi:MAG: hypothetical protein R3Y46_08320 [Opitutales bacterium]